MSAVVLAQVGELVRRFARLSLCFSIGAISSLPAIFRISTILVLQVPEANLLRGALEVFLFT
ncbi:hypothetical protein BDN70DRAFT_936608 [Pholiota conissans]|uniref:Uncharacterized protein n=1 Tax=Pholiota conissans TaxID=109636 RepID=A0A9P5YSV6_9AGAR|nr:hypothetical protein BDN70DRAFT_936608 [Pholiota conissans]